MSDLWRTAALVPVFAMVSVPTGPFTPWASRPDPFVSTCDDEEPDAAMPLDLEAVRDDAFAAGLAEGRREAARAIDVERAGLAQLAGALEALQPEPPHALAALLAETVGRLVRQIVGEVQIDDALLVARVGSVAAMIAEEAAPVKLRLHPRDLVRLDRAALPVELVADAGLAPGAVLLETSDGWVEDGPEAALDKLRGLLDRMGVTR